MKIVLIVVWFALPQQHSNAEFSNVASRQPVGVAMQEFDDKAACEAEAKRLVGPYIDAHCSPKSSSTPTER